MGRRERENDTFQKSLFSRRFGLVFQAASILLGLVLMVWLTHPALEAVREIVSSENVVPLLITVFVLDLVLLGALVAVWREVRRLRAELERLSLRNLSEFPRSVPGGGEQRAN